MKELKAVVSHLQINLYLKMNKLAEERHKPVIRKFKRREVYSAFKDHIWAADLADIQFNKGFRFLLCVIDIYSKYAWVVPLKDKKGVSIVNAFQSILNKSNRKPNKIWVVAERFIRTIKNKIYKQ